MAQAVTRCRCGHERRDHWDVKRVDKPPLGCLNLTRCLRLCPCARFEGASD